MQLGMDEEEPWGMVNQSEEETELSHVPKSTHPL